MTESSPSQVLEEEAKCLTCGQCCFGPENYVELYPEDELALGPVRAAVLVVTSTVEVEDRSNGNDGTERFMRMTNGHCAALDVSGGKFTCTIYRDRPLICQVYKFGSETCRAAQDGRLPPGALRKRPPRPPAIAASGVVLV